MLSELVIEMTVEVSDRLLTSLLVRVYIIAL